MLVFGESTLNDIAAMLLFRTFDTYARFPSSANASFSSSAISLMNHFLLSFFGSLSIGVLIALLTALIFKYFHFYRYPTLEITLMVISCYCKYSLLFFMLTTISAIHSFRRIRTVRNIGNFIHCYCNFTLYPIESE